MSDVEQWEHDEQRAMENEIISLREQVEKWKSLHESLTKLNEAQERRHEKQVEKLTKERDDLRSRRCEVCGYLEHEREHTGCLREQLAALAEQNEKLRKVLLLFKTTPIQLSQLVRACRGHTLEKFTDDITVQACWDSDRLDIGRCKEIVDTSFLGTPAAKLDEVVAHAIARSRKYL